MSEQMSVNMSALGEEPLANSTSSRCGHNLTGWEQQMDQLYTYFYLILFVPGLLLNTIALWVLCTHISKKTKAVIFMINLALADLAHVLSLPLRIYYYFTHTWPFGHNLCLLCFYLKYLNLYASIAFLVCISVQRCVFLLKPFCARRWRRRYDLLISGAVWVVVGLACSPFILMRSSNSASASQNLAYTRDPITHTRDPIIHPQDPIIHNRDRIIHTQDPIIHPQDPVIHTQDLIIHTQDPILHPQDPIIQPQDPIIHIRDPIIHTQDPITHTQTYAPPLYPGSSPGPLSSTAPHRPGCFKDLPTRRLPLAVAVAMMAFAEVLGFLLPLAAISYSTARIAHSLLQGAKPEWTAGGTVAPHGPPPDRRRALSSSSSACKSDRHMDRQTDGEKRRALRMVLSCSALFLFCFAPYHLNFLLYLMVSQDIVSHCATRLGVLHFHPVSLCLASLSCCLNPLLYYFLTTEFRLHLSRRTSSFTASLISSPRCSSSQNAAPPSRGRLLSMESNSSYRG